MLGWGWLGAYSIKQGGQDSWEGEIWAKTRRRRVNLINGCEDGSSEQSTCSLSRGSGDDACLGAEGQQGSGKQREDGMRWGSGGGGPRRPLERPCFS